MKFKEKIEKNFNKNKFEWGLTLGMLIGLICCLIGLALQPLYKELREYIKIDDIAHAEINTLQTNILYTFPNSPLNFVTGTNNISYSYFNTDAKGLGTFGGSVHLYDRNDNELTLGGDTSCMIMRKNSNTTFYYIGVSSSTSQSQGTWRIYIELNSNGNVVFNIQEKTGSTSTSFTSYVAKNFKIKFDSVNLTALNSSSNITAGVSEIIKQDLCKILNAVQTDYNISYSITNGTATTTTLPASGGTIQITPNNDFTYPQTITVTGTANYTYDNTTGIITLTSVSSNLSIAAICPPKPYNLTLNNQHCYISTDGGGTDPQTIPSTGGNLYINPAYNYTYPQTVTVTGTANYTYDNTTGIITLTSVSSDLTIDIICELIQVNLNSGYYLFPSIKKLYDMGNLTIPVPNGLKLYQFTNESLTGINTPASGGVDYIGGYKYTTAEPVQEYSLTNSDYLTNNQTSTTFWINNQGRLIRTIQSDNLTIEFAGFWVIYIPANSTIEITSQNFYNELIAIPELRLIQEDLYYILRQFQNDLATTATEKYNEGYSAGYDLGVSTNIISDSTSGVINSIFSGIFGTIFNIEIFPNFPLYILLLIPLVFSMLGVIFWLIRGR